MVAPARKHGVFCLEGDWHDIRDETTVEPAFQLLKSCAGIAMPYIHRDVGTLDQFRHYLSKWRQKRMARYPILYLAFHGEPKTLFIGDNRKREARVSLDQLGDMLAGACKGRIIHFGACDTLDVHGATLDAFMRKTQATALLGYRGGVDWVQSTAFEIIVLAELQNRTLTRPGLRATKDRINLVAGSLSKALGFRMRVSKHARPGPVRPAAGP
jgi:hypothetical protein